MTRIVQHASQEGGALSNNIVGQGLHLFMLGEETAADGVPILPCCLQTGLQLVAVLLQLCHLLLLLAHSLRLHTACSA